MAQHYPAEPEDIYLEADSPSGVTEFPTVPGTPGPYGPTSPSDAEERAALAAIVAGESEGPTEAPSPSQGPSSDGLLAFIGRVAGNMGSWVPDLPTLQSGWRELQEMSAGASNLLGTAMLQPARLLPKGEAGSLLEATQRTAVEKSAEVGTAFSPSVFFPAMARSIGESWTRNPTTSLRAKPVETIGNWALPFGVVSGGLRVAAKVPGVLGKGKIAATLNKAADVIAPGALVRKGVNAGVDVVGLRPTVTSWGEALTAQRTRRRHLITAQEFVSEELTILEGAIKDVHPGDLGRLVDLAEGTNLKNQRFSPEAYDAVRTYRRIVQDKQDRIAATLSNGNPGAYVHLQNIFDDAKYKPLAEELSHLSGTEVTGEQARLMHQQGLVPWVTEEPVYFPHRSLNASAAKADPFQKSLDPYVYGAMQKRTNNPEFIRDFGKAVSEHMLGMEKYLADLQTMREVLNTQGVPLHGIKGPKELTDALADLEAKTGRKHVYLSDDIGLINPNYGQKIDYALPAVTADKLLADAAKHSKFENVLDAITQPWRNAVLAYNPAWNIGNFYGNVGLTVLSGSYDPVMAKKLAKGGIKNVEISSGLHHMESKLLNAIKTNTKTTMRWGEVPIGQWTKALTEAIPEPIRRARVTERLYNLNTSVDQIFREGVFAGKVKQQATRELREAGHGGLRLNPAEVTRRSIEIAKDPVRSRAAIDHVNYYMGNYFDMSPIERRVVRQVIPFWAWHKSMTKLVLTLPVEAPGRMQVLINLGRMVKDAEDDPTLPKELKSGKIPIHTTQEGNTIYVDFHNLVPYNQSIEGFPGMSPVAQLIGAGMTGTVAFGKPPIPAGYEDVGGRLYAVSEGKLPTEMEFRDRQNLALAQSAQESLRVPLVRMLETLIMGEAPRPGTPLFEKPVASPRAPFASKQTRPEAVMSMSGVKVREYNVPLSRARHMRREVRALRQGVPKLRPQEPSRQQQDPERQRLQEILDAP